eukprot:s97_g18.t1
MDELQQELRTAKILVLEELAATNPALIEAFNLNVAEDLAGAGEEDFEAWMALEEKVKGLVQERDSLREMLRVSQREASMWRTLYSAQVSAVPVQVNVPATFLASDSRLTSPERSAT